MSDNTSPHEKLTALLKPYVEPLVKHRLREEENNMPLRERCGIDIILTWLNLAMKYEWVKRWIRDKNFRKHPLPFRFIKPPESEIEKCDDWEVCKTLDVIICFWFEILAFFARDHHNKVILAELDDAMLPIQAPSILKGESVDLLLNETCAALVVSAQDVRNILWAIRQSLPGAQVLPEAMHDYLKSAGITAE